MRNRLALVSVSIFALALAACDSGPQEADTNTMATGGTVAPAAGDAPALDAAGEEGADQTPDAAETDAPAGTQTTAAATPAPAASRSAAATPAAAPAGPPQAFTTCGVCHSVQPGQNGVGPTLAGVVGRRAGSVAGANYSPGMQAATITWTEANLNRYLADPQGVVPGTLMPPPGLSAADRQAVVAYLRTL